MYHFVSAQVSTNSLDWQMKNLVPCSVILGSPFETRLPNLFELSLFFSSDLAILLGERDFATLSSLEPSHMFIALEQQGTPRS